MATNIEGMLIQRMRTLPVERHVEVLDFVDFLKREAIEGYLGAPPYTLEALQENAYGLTSATARLFLKWIAVVTQCAEAFQRLAAGYVTWIHGDLHPGNIRVAAARIQFVD